MPATLEPLVPGKINNMDPAYTENVDILSGMFLHFDFSMLHASIPLEDRGLFGVPLSSVAKASA